MIDKLNPFHDTEADTRSRLPADDPGTTGILGPFCVRAAAHYCLVLAVPARRGPGLDQFEFPAEFDVSGLANAQAAARDLARRLARRPRWFGLFECEQMRFVRRELKKYRLESRRAAVVQVCRWGAGCGRGVTDQMPLYPVQGVPGPAA